MKVPYISTDWLSSLEFPSCPADANGNSAECVSRFVTETLADSDRFFSYDPVRDYRLEGNRLSFTSPVDTRYPENNTAQALWFPAPRDKGRAVIVLPQGVAFAIIAGLPPEYGLYTSIITPIVAALFGSSLHLISGPTTAISIIVFSSISPLAEPGSPQYIQLVLTLTCMAGAYQLAFGLATQVLGQERPRGAYLFGSDTQFCGDLLAGLAFFG